MEEKKNKRGGKRLGAGRKPTGRTFSKQVWTRLNAEEYERALQKVALEKKTLSTLIKEAFLKSLDES